MDSTQPRQERSRECLVMAKPAGPRCNMRCAYCYYIGKDAVLGRGPGRLPTDLLERFIDQRLQSSREAVVHFEWHGGEPTLLGLDYFRTIVRMQRAHLPPGRTVSNGLQTNGYLLNGAWASFLAAEGFSVGLSLDGPADQHDAFRRSADGGPTHARVERAYALLKERDVFVNLLCVLHARNATEPEMVYDYFRGLGATHLQFLPLVAGTARTDVTACTDATAPAEATARAQAMAAAPEAVGEFLCRVFDRWIREDVGRVVIQNIDEALRPIYGLPHALCIHRETCGDVAVLERDGAFYACDHFVDADHLIGNLRERSLGDLASDPRMIDFGNAKRDTLPRVCRGCDVLSWCNGGCPKDRAPAAPGEAGGVNRLCA
ncbi:MAG: anaerobic sulfatase maturase, partial [Spirochaetia bacterium]